jgi:RNA polymerase primary sigma factor
MKSARAKRRTSATKQKAPGNKPAITKSKASSKGPRQAGSGTKAKGLSVKTAVKPAAKAPAKTVVSKAAPKAAAKAPKVPVRATPAAPSVAVPPTVPGAPVSASAAADAKAKRRRRTAPAGIAPSEPERDILDQYLYEVSTYPLLKGHEEIDIARKIRAGDADALQELVKRNLRFVISVAKKYQNRGLPLIDLIGEGNVGLLTAARKFDPDQGVKFISYAVWWIRQAILSSLARQGRTVRVPLNRTADLSRIIKASEILRQKLRREPTPEELAQLTGLSVDVVQSLAALNTGDVRLDAPMDPDGDRSLIERFVADEMPDTEEEAMNRFLNDEIESALNTLPPRDAKVLRLYFGLEGGREHTLEEIGSMLGVTRERVRQLRDRALKRLREGEVGRALGSFAA